MNQVEQSGGFEVKWPEAGSAASAYAARRRQESEGFVWFKGDFWVWQGGRWRRLGHQALLDDVLVTLKDATYLKRSGKPEEGTYERVRLAPNLRFVQDVVRFLQAEVKVGFATAPAWMGGGEGRFDPDWCVAFEDRVVDVRTGSSVARGKEWFGNVVPGEWEGGGGCERWERCLEEWGQGDKEWGKLLQRMMGYMLMGYRGWRKWGLIAGVTGGGKGVIQHVVKALLGDEMTVKDLPTLVDKYGRWGLQYSRVLWVAEVSREGGQVGRTAAMLVKSLVGGDPIAMNRKYFDIEGDVLCRPFVCMTSNVVPELDDGMGGLTNKLLVLPIRVGFDLRGAEFGLKERLVREELGAIGRWAVQGAMELAKLEREGRQEEMWPKLEDAAGLVEDMQGDGGGVVGEFLAERFRKMETGFVAREMLVETWVKWVKGRGIGGRKDVPGERGIVAAVRKTGMWGIQEARLPGNGPRGFRGMGLK